jgi:hypothetical protein
MKQTRFKFADEVPPGHKVIYTPYIVKNGTIIYPKRSKVFRLVVPIGKN